MKRLYESHEQEYQRMEAAGTASWMERQYDWAVDPQHVRIFEDMLAQSWCPPSGRILEVGCGTGPILRWFAERGYRGTGIDVSQTAIKLARQQSAGQSVTFRRADICRLDPTTFPKIDLSIDGQCLHCLTSDSDRAAMLRNVRAMLHREGVLLVLTMCGPVDRQRFKQYYPAQRLRGSRIYVPFEGAGKYVDALEIRGKFYAPTRCVPHWQAILRELRQAGFETRLVRYAPPAQEEPCGALAVCATAVE